MKKDVAVKITNVSKVYKLYDKPSDRLKSQFTPLKRNTIKSFMH